jgi:hypothetical protein
MPPANPLLRREIAAAAAITALIVFSLAMIVARARNASRQAATQMRAVLGTQQPVVAEAEKREQLRYAILVDELRKSAQAKRAIKTPAQVAARLPAALAPLPQPLSISLPPTAQDEPAAPAVITVPQIDLKPLFDHLQDCRACQEQLAAARQDLEDERAKVSALTIERDAAVKASRGGGFWSRLRMGAKWFAIGGVMGALVASASRR